MDAIVVEDLHKSLGGQPVLRGVNLRVARGETCAILGRSGSGKTVLLKHLLGLMAPDRGRVAVFGQELATADRASMERVRQRLGVLFQADGLFDSLTSFENVAFPMRERTHATRTEIHRRVRQVLEWVRLKGIDDRFPGELSGGMRKRLAFARSIVLEPELLLLDDPTAGLDPLTSRAVIDVIRRGRDELGLTAVVITHDLVCAFETAHRIAFLHEGRIVIHAPPEELLGCPHPAVRAFIDHWRERTGQEPIAPAP
jgi:phospholipid/cholesterol/gamma-HCH transport system ATP-binding protein